MKNHAVGIDQAVIKRCQAGDLSAFDAIFDRFQQRVYNLAVTIVKDSALAEDVVQRNFCTIGGEITKKLKK